MGIPDAGDVAAIATMAKQLYNTNPMQFASMIHDPANALALATNLLDMAGIHTPPVLQQAMSSSIAIAKALSAASPPPSA